VSELEAYEMTSNPNPPPVFQHVYETSAQARVEAIEQLLKAAEIGGAQHSVSVTQGHTRHTSVTSPI